MKTDAQIESIINQLTLKEKIHIMSGNSTLLSEALGFFKRGKKGVYNFRPYPAGGVKRLNIPAMKFVDGPRGVVSGQSTCFPVSMARGASWDIALEEKIGESIAKEIRAHGGNYFGGVCINLLRHPAWGRAQETYGEDSHLLGELGGALTRGVQKHNVMACVKHYALNSMENARFYVDVNISERALHEVYLPHFKKCIVEDKAASVMGSYNKVLGEYACENKLLLDDILREQWGFKGFTISDFIWGIHNPVASVKNGMDMEMHIASKYTSLEKAISNNELSEADLNKSVERILKTLFDFTERKDSQTYDKSIIACKEHIQLAQESAEKSMVLLKNENHTLPFNLNSTKKIALLGSLCDEQNIGDHGSSLVRPKYVTTPYQGFNTFLDGKGVELVKYNGTSLIKAKKIASQADAIVLVVGYKHNHEGEYIINSKLEKILSLFDSFGGDRDSLRLPKKDLDLIEAVCAVNKNVCVCVVGGSAVIMKEWRHKVPAILMNWYSGMEGGTALAKIIFGQTNPSGKLPFSIPTSEKDLPFFNKLASKIEYGYYHGYSLLDKENKQPAYAFGFGLSYTQFVLKNFTLLKSNLTLGETIQCTIDVENIGDMSGEEVVQIYAGFVNSAVDRPVKKLIAFNKVFVESKKVKKVEFEISLEKLMYYKVQAHDWELEKISYELLAGNSSLDNLFHTKIVNVI